MKHWRRKYLKNKKELSPRQAAVRGTWTTAIKMLYAYRDMYNRQLSGEEYRINPYEVDHCIPVGKPFCGLNIYTNMWIVRRSMNTRGVQHRTNEQIIYALTQANLDRFKAHEAWPNC